MDNRNLKADELYILRKKIVYAVTNEGLTQKAAAKYFGFSEQSVSSYIRAYKEKGEASFEYKKRGAKLRTYCKLTVGQEDEIKQIILNKTPDQVGIEATLWTRKVVKELIEIKFGIQYEVTAIGRMLRRLGFSPQKPKKKAYEQDPKKVKAWFETRYPTIKKKHK